MKCNQEGCTEHAAYTLVWTEQKYYCAEHAMRVVNIANAMGYPTPAKTARILTLDEMIDGDESEANDGN